MPVVYEQGVGLIEVMVAVLLLSVAVLGFSALQMRAVSATDESLMRTQVLSIVRGLSENMRANPNALEAYEAALNGDSTITSIDQDSCVTLTESCTSEQLAVKEAKAAKKIFDGYGINIGMTQCPGTTAFSEIKCIIAAWGDTKPLMSDSVADACAKSNGTYKRGSTCVIVEAY